jgi:hypothetical protein
MSHFASIRHFLWLQAPCGFMLAPETIEMAKATTPVVAERAEAITRSFFYANVRGQRCTRTNTIP